MYLRTRRRRLTEFTGSKSKPLIFDGAMGTYLQKISPSDLTIEEYNIEKSAIIEEIHRQYIEAGAQAIKTNTFGANPIQYDRDLCRTYLEAGAKIALKFQDQAEIYGSIGPMETPDLQDYLFVAEVLYQAGIRKFLWETFPEADKLLEVIDRFCKDHADTLHITSFAVFPSGETRLGVLAQEALEAADKNPHVQAMGLNCISGPYHLVQLVKSLPTFQTPLGLMPNSGYPTMVDGRLQYKENPSYFSQALAQGLNYGLSYLGGCCGTDPSYILELSQHLKEVPDQLENLEKEEKVLEKTESNLKKKLKSGKQVMVVEYDPPQEATRDYFKKLSLLRNMEVDAVTLADCPIGRPRMDASLTSLILKKDYGLDSVVHMTCRDRNINAIKALLLGLSLEGIQDILLITGDPVPSVDREDVKAVFQFNSARLAAFVKTLNRDLENPFTISGALNINAQNFDSELDKAKRKIESGVELFFTQPIMGKNAIVQLRRAQKELDVPILAGIMPLVSYRNAQYLHNQVSGMQVDQEVLDSFHEGLSREEGESLGIQWALEFMNEIGDEVAGFYLITPFQRLHVIERLLKDYGQGKEK